MHKYKLLALSIVVSMIAASAVFPGCSKTNETALRQKSGITCDTVGMQYQRDIVPILTGNCYSCHSAQTYMSSGSNLNLQDFTTLKDEAVNGELLNAIRHTGNVTPMPLDLPPLSDCEINRITDWIDNGAQNN